MEFLYQNLSDFQAEGAETNIMLSNPLAGRRCPPSSEAEQQIGARSTLGFSVLPLADLLTPVFAKHPSRDLKRPHPFIGPAGHAVANASQSAKLPRIFTMMHRAPLPGQFKTHSQAGISHPKCLSLWPPSSVGSWFP
jgi:hypothetical protein